MVEGACANGKRKGAARRLPPHWPISGAGGWGWMASGWAGPWGWDVAGDRVSTVSVFEQRKVRGGNGKNKKRRVRLTGQTRGNWKKNMFSVILHTSSTGSFRCCSMSAENQQKFKVHSHVTVHYLFSVITRWDWSADVAGHMHTYIRHNIAMAIVSLACITMAAVLSLAQCHRDCVAQLTPRICICMRQCRKKNVPDHSDVHFECF